jgi:hypothetical protein
MAVRLGSTVHRIIMSLSLRDKQRFVDIHAQTTPKLRSGLLLAYWNKLTTVEWQPGFLRDFSCSSLMMTKLGRNMWKTDKYMYIYECVFWCWSTVQINFPSISSQHCFLWLLCEPIKCWSTCHLVSYTEVSYKNVFFIRLRIVISNKCTSVCLLYIQTLLHVSAPLGHLQGVIHSRTWSSSKTICGQYKTVCGQSRLLKVKML